MSNQAMSCKFHPLTPAHNHCERCEAQFCLTCSDETELLRRSRESTYRCFICGAALTPIGAAKTVEPFWSRLSSIYLYPLGMQAVAALVVVALLSAVLRNFGLGLLIPSAAIMLYSFACLRETAQGNLTAPGFEACFEGSLKPIFYAILVMFFAMLGAGFAFQMFGTGVGILASVFLVAALPAAMMQIAISEELAPALNIGGLFSLMVTTGASYFVMLLFIIIMFSSIAIITALIGSSSNSFVGVLAQSLVGNYYGIVVYHIMGYLVYQHHDELGFDIKQETAEGKQRDDAKRMAAKLDVLIMAGEYPAARELAASQISRPNVTLWDWSRAFKLMCSGKPNRQAAQMFAKYVKKLESADKGDEISDAYLMLLKNNSGFVIKDLALRLKVANSLYEVGQYPASINMLSSFHQDCQDKTMVAAAHKLKGDSFAKLPGKEKQAKHYHALSELEMAGVSPKP